MYCTENAASTHEQTERTEEEWKKSASDKINVNAESKMIAKWS